MPLGEGVAKFVRVRDGAPTTLHKDPVAGEDRAMQLKRGETPPRKTQADEQERGRKQQQSQPNQQPQDLQPSDHRYSSNGFHKKQQSTLDARRLEIANKARVKPPVTRLGSNPTVISKGDMNGRSRTIPLMPPPQIIETLQTTKEPTYGYDDGRPFYETDTEHLDNTTIFSDETQSRDDEHKVQGMGYNPDRFSHDRVISNPETPIANSTDESYLESSRVNREDGSYLEGDSAGDEEDGDTEDGRSSEGSSEEKVSEDDAIRDGTGQYISLSANAMVNLQKEAVDAKDYHGSMVSSQTPQQPFVGRLIPVTNQPAYPDGLNTPYPSTASSEAYDYAPNPQARIGTPPQSQVAIPKYHVGQHRMTRSNQCPKEHRVSKAQPARNKSIDQQDLQHSTQQSRTDRPTQTFNQARHESSLRHNQPQEQEQLTHNSLEHSQIGEEDIAADLMDETFSYRLNGNLEDCQIPKQKRPLNLDYDTGQLSKMAYDDLRNEPFDHDPSAPAETLPENLASASLTDKLEYIIDQAKHNNVPIEQQRALFSSLPIDQFEECGDLIVDHFAAIIAKFKHARREKRKVAMEFEEEVARREEAISSRKQAIGRDMGRLRKAGEDVIKGKGS